MSGTIKRSAGIAVPGWAGPRPGGGYSGARADLDNAVQEAATWLAERYPSVEIRFNSDRESGGAFVRPEPRRRASGGGPLSADAGLTFELRLPPDHPARKTWPWPAGLVEHEGVLAASIYADAKTLKDPAALPSAAWPYEDRTFASLTFATATEARAWFEANVKGAQA